jgi:hypothetical protein
MNILQNCDESDGLCSISFLNRTSSGGSLLEVVVFRYLRYDPKKQDCSRFRQHRKLGTRVPLGRSFGPRSAPQKACADSVATLTTRWLTRLRVDGQLL